MTPFADALLAPTSIALVGASDDPAKTASRPLRFLRAGGFPGKIYPIARRPTVSGERTWPTLADLPARPDHAFILLPTEPAIEAVAECVRLGIPAVTVLADGFAEAGPAGAAHQRRLQLLLQGSQTRLLGPNSLGLVNLHRQTVLTANAAFAEPGLPTGGLFVASQSGSVIGALASRGKARGIGFATLVSVGAEADLTIGELCAAALDDPQITAFLLFIETIRAAPALRRFAVDAAARNKPVLAYKLGRSQAAAELAESHTGALAGEDDVADAFLRDCGIARVDTFEALLEAPALLRRLPIRQRGATRPSVGIVTTTGGGAAMVVDQLGIRGIDVAAPGPATTARLATAGIRHNPGRILDLTLAGARYDVMKSALHAMLTDPAYDLVVAVIGSSARFQPELAVRPVQDSGGDDARLAAFLVPEAPEALRSLADAGIPAFRTPESCADAIAAALHRRPPRFAADNPAITGPRHQLDELSAYALLTTLGIPSAPCQEYAGACRLTFPLAVKLLSTEIAHKSDLGGVILDVEESGLPAAAAQIRQSATTAGLQDIRILLQQMTGGLAEALLGYRIDPQIGPIILLAPGGLAAELHKHRSVRIAPIDLATAHEMIDEIPAFALLKGYRTHPPGDLDALAETLVALSRPGPTVLECEINPLIIKTDGVVAVDAVAWVVANNGAASG